MSKRWLFGIAVLAVFGLVVAACGDDDEGTGDVETADDAPADDDAPPDDTDDDTTETAPPSTEDTAPDDPIELTDSFRGVTREKILIGHTSVDFDALRNDFNLDLTFQDFGPQMDAIVAWYNDNGGVLGREIEVVHRIFVPVGAATAEKVCLELTEDIEVFAVLNGFSGPGAEDQNTCISEFHDTVLVGGLPSARQAADSGGLWVTPDMSLDRRNPAAVNLMEQAGVLDELGPMMIIGSNAIEEPLVRQMQQALIDAGVDVPEIAWITTTGDQPATNGEVDVFIAKARSQGISTIVLLGEGEFRNQAFFRNAPDFTYIMGNGDRITDWLAIPPEGLQEGTRVLTNRNGPSPVDDPRTQECVAAVEAAMDIEVLPTEELGETDPNYWSGTSGSCQRMALFVQIAEAAGPELTNDSWIAALDNVPDLSIPGYEFVSLGSDKVDARDQLILVEYDLATRTFVALTDFIDVG